MVLSEGLYPLLPTLIRPEFGCPVALSAPATFLGRIVPDSPRLPSHTNPPRVSRVLPWCSGSPARCACPASCVPARSVSAPASSSHVSRVCPRNPKACVLLSTSWSPFVRTTASLLPPSLYPWLGIRRSHPYLLRCSPRNVPHCPPSSASPAAFFGLACRSPGAPTFPLLCPLVFSRFALPLTVPLSAS